MIILQAKLKGLKEFITGKRLVFFIPNDKISENDDLAIRQELGEEGWLTFSPDKLKAEIEVVMRNRKIGASEEGKSKSEILRGTLFQYWNKNYSKKPFEEFYQERMNDIITSIKQETEKIDIERIDETLI
ncbi:MAG: hypothetical protein MUO72_09580 [Bacteroidales bacterium]|nr:hypothetical protein [Bacteroidales bacterium]